MLNANLIGNLGGDAVVKLINNKNFLSFTVAHTENIKGNPETVWVNCLMYGDGGNLRQYLKKGTKVFVNGDLRMTAFTTKTGELKAGADIMVSKIELLGSKKEEAETSAQPEQTADPFSNYSPEKPF